MKNAIILGLLSVGIVSVGMAQELTVKKPLLKVNPSTIKLVAPQALAATKIETSQSNVIGRATTATNEPLTAGVLSGFQFHYHNGDHKVRQISLLQNQGKAEAVFADQNSDDPFLFNASWYQANYQLAEVTAVGGGEFDIDLPAAPMGHVPLLAGFSFQRKDGTDANLRTIGVRITPDNKKVRVILVDDQGADFRGFERQVALNFALSMVPFAQAEATGLTLFQGMDRMRNKEFAKNGLRQFHATVQVAFVPASAVLSRKSVSSGSRAIEGGAPPKPSDKVGLSGFLFNFNNSDHHLLALGVHLQPNTLTRRQMPEAVSFQDNNQDDPIQWYVDYVSLK